jgi:hypothetical protein
MDGDGDAISRLPVGAAFFGRGWGDSGLDYLARQVAANTGQPASRAPYPMFHRRTKCKLYVFNEPVPFFLNS